MNTAPAVVKGVSIAAAALVMSTMAVPAAAQQPTVTFSFVAPAATMTANFDQKLIRGGGGYADGYRSVTINAATLATFRKVATASAPNMLKTFDELQPGRPLRAKLDRMLQLSQGAVVTVSVMLVDDATGVVNATGWGTWTDPADNRTYVLPVGGNGPLVGSRHVGAIIVGEHWAKLQIDNTQVFGWAYWEAVILHEALHTQCTGLSTKWGNVRITYGLDEQHMITEFLGAQDKAFEEGLGSFYGFAHFQPKGLAATNTFFSLTDGRYDFYDGSIPASWNDLRQAVTKTEPVTPIPKPVSTAQPARTSYTRYLVAWLRAPGFYLLFNEWTTTGVMMYFHSRTNNDPAQAFGMIEEMSKLIVPDVRRRDLAFASNHLALQLEAFAKTAPGQAKAAAGTLTSSMFAVALVDLLTHFGMTEDEFKLEYTRANLAPKSLAIAEYWKHRAAIRALVDADIKATPIRIEKAVDAIHKYFQARPTILVQP
jgi:hypothetical protein